MLRKYLLFFAGVYLATLPFGEPLMAKPPNVVVLLIDDLGYTDLGCYGSEFHQTPRIDTLASQSLRFTDFYSAHPVCSPTRAALMTGKAPQRVGITQWIAHGTGVVLPLEEVTMGEAFADAGYATGYIGKWHLGEADAYRADRQGFSWTKGVNGAGAPPSYFFPYKSKRKDARAQYRDVPDLEDGKEGDYLTDKLTDHALTFIEENRERPFFLCFGHYAVHTPIQAPERLVELNKQRRKEKFEDSETPTFAEGDRARTRGRQDNPTYAGMIANLDANVGRVIDQLDRLGLRENTIIVFTSDNGGLSTLQNKRIGPTSVRPLRAGKGWTYEGGVLIPTFVNWPEKIKPGKSSTPGITMDFYPTLLELCGLELRPSQHIDGHSLVSALRGQPNQTLKERFLAWHYPHNHGSGHEPSNGMRMGKWKLIHRIPANQYELYDLSSDVGESKEIGDQHPDQVTRMKSAMKSWLEETVREPSLAQ